MNKITFLFLVLILLLCFQNLSAQKNKQSAVHLKNGSIIYGKILENHPDSIIKIQDNCNNILVYKQNEIQSVNFIKSEEISENGSPFRLCFDTGLAGFGGTSDPGLSLLISGLYRFKDRYYSGLTSGIEYFGMPLLPIAGEFQADLFKRNTTPFIYIRAGYGFKLIQNEENDNYTATYNGGIMFGGGIGIKKRFSPEFAMTFSIGYRHQQTYEAYDYLINDWWSNDYERHYFLNRAAFRVGLIF